MGQADRRFWALEKDSQRYWLLRDGQSGVNRVDYLQLLRKYRLWQFWCVYQSVKICGVGYVEIYVLKWSYTEDGKELRAVVVDKNQNKIEYISRKF